jgi:HEAT repeat protein
MKNLITTAALVVIFFMSRSNGSSQTKPETNVSILTSQLTSSDFKTRFNAGETLFKMGTNAAPAVAVIGRLLEDESDKIHDVMLLVLENCPEEATPFKATLEKYLTSSDSVLRIHCARTLWVIDHTYANQARLVAQKSLGESNAGARVDGASLLWRLDHDANAVVPTLIALLSDQDKAYDYRTIKFLENIGPPAKDAVPAIQNWLISGRMHEAFATNAAVAAIQKIEDKP